jgi:hypothetical protein
MTGERHNYRMQATACAVAMGTRARAVLAHAAPDAERWADRQDG